MNLNFGNIEFRHIKKLLILLFAILSLWTGFNSYVRANGSPIDSFGEDLSDYIDADEFEITNIEEVEVTAQVVEAEKEEESIVDQVIRNITETAKKVSKFLQESEALRNISLIAAPIAALPAVATIGLSELPVLAYRIFLGILNALGLRRKGKKFGYIYDARTKEPLSLSVVRFFDKDGGLIETDVTNAFGHFNSNLPEGEYRITATKSNYSFPSKIVTGNLDYPISNVYHGELKLMDEDSFGALSIPLDPRELDAKEQAIATVRTQLYRVWHTLGTILFFIGAFQAIHNYLFEPSDINFLMVMFYLMLFIFLIYRSNKDKQRIGVVTYEGKAMPGIEVYLKQADGDKVLDKRITKSDGTYNFVVVRGSFELDVNDESYDIANESDVVLQNSQNKPVVYSRPLKLTTKSNSPSNLASE